ncbi:MAG: tellurium resistance protein TerC [Alphaproteobacteria bacterium PA2]|nr:MAG: tellurium resistance protein TerC [Alphaproteobacteria bacterium PA2]
MDFINALPNSGSLITFFQVVMIDLALAGDNAVAVGLAAAGLPVDQRRKAIIYGLLGAVVMRIGFALMAVFMLKQIGLLLAGGILLIWVCWKMWSELREQHAEETAQGEQALEDATGVEITNEVATTKPQAKTLGQALTQILMADVAMSLDNVLAVAGAAREHPQVMVAGLLIAITLVGFAASYIAQLLHRFRWLGYLGLAIVFYVALHMMWEGHRTVVIDLKGVEAYNAAMPDLLDISAAETAERNHQRK